jgi:tetratricopeptide (TPR) repeat protein
MPGLRRPTTVSTVDASGTVVQVPLALWRTDELPRALERHWAEPDDLARLLECALDVRAHAEVLPAAEQLSRIDPDRERRYGLPAVVFAANGQFSRAEELLDRGEGLYGESWFGLYARAEVAFAGNRRSKGLELLREALRIAPDASRPLRRLIEENQGGGSDPAESVIRDVASSRGSWRARLWLARFGRTDARQASSLVRSAVEESRDEPDILAVASGVLAGRGLTGELVNFAAPRYRIGRDRLECGINLLFGFLSAGRKAPAQALLARLASVLEDAGLGEFADFYETAFRNLRVGDAGSGSEKPHMELLRAMASAVRLGSSKARQRYWTLLADTSLLVPVTRPWIELPLFESPWPGLPQVLEIVTGVDSEAREVAIAFTDERTMRAWGPLRSPALRMTSRALLELVAEEKECSLLVNPAGPTATELALADIDAFLAGRSPAGEDSGIRFLAEPLRREVPEPFRQAAAAFLKSSGIVRDAWLFELVDDRRGVNPAIAVDFSTDASARDERQLLIDGPGQVSWDAQRSRRVRFIPLNEGRFADYIRAIGVRIDVR